VCITAMGFNKRRRGIYYIRFGNLLSPFNMFKPRRGKRDTFYIDHGAPTTHNHERPQLRHPNRPSDSYGPSMRKPLALGPGALPRAPAQWASEEPPARYNWRKKKSSSPMKAMPPR